MSLTHPDMKYPTTTRYWGTWEVGQTRQSKVCKNGENPQSNSKLGVCLCSLLSVGPHPSPQVHTFNTSPLKSVGPSKTWQQGHPLPK